MPVSVQIAEDVAEVLRASTVEGNAIRLPGSALDRKLYQATDKVLQALGGKWNTKQRAHLFANDPAPMLEAALSDGKAVDELMTRKKRLQLFETSADLALRLCGSISIGEGDRCLEPSAGRGRIVAAMEAVGATRIVAIEIDAANATALDAQAVADDIHTADFLAIRPDYIGRFDAIAMNPPFTGNQDVRHVRHAFDFLRSGGRLAAIVSQHGFIGQEREAVDWRQWLSDVGASVEVIPAGAFKESGTSIETRMVKIIRV